MRGVLDGYNAFASDSKVCNLFYTNFLDSFVTIFQQLTAYDILLLNMDGIKNICCYKIVCLCSIFQVIWQISKQQWMEPH